MGAELGIWASARCSTAETDLVAVRIPEDRFPDTVAVDQTIARFDAARGDGGDNRRHIGGGRLRFAIYLMMVAATFTLLYAGISGATGTGLWIAVGLLAIESAVFAAYGFKCPLTALAVRYGARTGHVFDTLLPENVTRHTFHVFGTLMDRPGSIRSADRPERWSPDLH